jgi:hypothetical protein
MSTTVNYNFFTVINAQQTRDGEISLTYTLNNDGSISNASFTYTGPNSGAQGPYPVTFTGTASPYSGTCSMAPPTYQPLNIEGQGSYKSGTMTLDTSANATYPLSGVFKQAASLIADPTDLAWDASTGVGFPKDAKKAAGK